MRGGQLHAAAALDLLGRMQDVRAQNLANVNTVGYRKRIASAEVFAHAMKKAAGMTLPRFKSNIDFSQGLIDLTGNSLDVAIEGKGFFALETQDGVRFTRNGNFHLDQKGMLVAADGSRVQGENGPIQADPALGKLEIDLAGKVTQDGEPVGTLRVVEFEHEQRLIPDAEGRFREGPRARPTDSVDSKVRQGYLEYSNTNAVDEMVQMIAGMRAFEAAQKAMTGLDRIRAQGIGANR